MSSSIKPLNLYGGGPGPNPWKVVIYLKELEIPYETTVVKYENLKTPEYEKVNPNGRLPALYDPNTDITVWESGAILEYLAEQYDKENKFSFPNFTADNYTAKTWLHYQMSGQGPYFGQATWFKYYHPENVPSAFERYWKESKRVVAVLNKHLEGKEYFVGDKFSYVDMAFFAWQVGFVKYVGQTENFDYDTEAPNVKAWIDRLTARPCIAEALKEQASYIPPPRDTK
ncbi:glutathione S- transferase, nitrogen catabolite repression regulator [Arachnomyces sp. PD_36]|nr:glutathione S- transferase, nitrogen catabolite repression regulator [Arachnomyces sp. PD_36]